MKKKHSLLRRVLLSVALFLCIGGIVFLGWKKGYIYPQFEVGQKIDSLNGVYVYYNGGFSNIEGREVTPDGYNLGLKYQCVHFVKKYYYEQLNHIMPNSYGNAKDFFNPTLKDGQINKERNLIQFSNPSSTKPKVNDLLIFGETNFNAFGHIVIVSSVEENQIEIIQQNVASSRETFKLKVVDGKWKVMDSKVLGWLGKR